MSAVELLREAAQAMRERANGVYPPHLDWRKLVMAHSGTALDHAVSWHPAVALAVADWLEFTAERAALARAVGLPYNAVEKRAVVVARAYLGRDEP